MSALIRTIVAVFVMSSLVTSVGAVEYRLIDICPFSGVSSYAADINNKGQVVGYYGNQAFIWSRENGLRTLGDLGGGFSQAASINDRGEIVGVSRTSTGKEHAFYWSESTGMLDIGMTLLGNVKSGASEINNSGQILLHPPATNWWRPVLWDPVKGFMPVNSQLITGHVIAHDMNDNGELVGFYNGKFPDNPSFIWSPTDGIRDLPRPPHTYTEPYAINNKGVAVGRISTGSGTNACLWDPVSGLMDLGPMSGYREICAYGINASRMVVGDMVFSGRSNAFVWTEDSGYLQLSYGCENPYGAWDSAHAVNDAGVIIGSANFGWTGTYNTRAAVWEPVPEPTSLFMLLSGCSIASFCWRKRSKALCLE